MFIWDQRIAIGGEQIEAETQIVPLPTLARERDSGFLRGKREEDEVSCINEEFIGAR